MTVLAQPFVGVGIYAKGDAPGALHAQWARSDRISSAPEKGTVCGGAATGGPVNGFAGSYSIVYTDDQGKPGEPYKLIIKSAGDAYQLEWQKDGQAKYFGVGIELDGKLVIGWAPSRL